MSDDKIYFNVTMPGPTPPITGLNSELPATYTQQLSKSIIDDPSEYYLAVVRFQIPVQTIPIFITEVQQGGDINATIYSVTLQNGSLISQQYIEWIPTHLDLSSNSSTYYYNYDYYHFITLVNTALANAFAIVNTSSNLLPPYFQLDGKNISLVAQTAYQTDIMGNLVKGSGIQIFVNTPLEILIDGISDVFKGYNATLGRNFQLLVLNNNNNFYNPSYVTPTYPPNYFIMTSQYSTLSNWNSLKSIQLVSNEIPIVREYVPSAINTGDISGVGILKDFIPIFNSGSDTARTTLEYVLSGPYQLINMTGKVPLSRIDISIYWTDKYGNQYPLFIPYNQNATIKLGFFKKSTFTS